MKNDNRAFWRSVHYLSQPYIPVVLSVILLNDSILQHFWPSVITGKLSNLAWLFLAPAAVTAGLAWLAPQKLRRHEYALAGVGFGWTAASFALLKTVPAFHDGVINLWQAGLGFPAAAVLDPTDLVALVSVALAGWLWLKQNPLGTVIPRRAVFVIPLLACLTLADAAAPDYGIACLEDRDGQVVAYSSYHAYTSPDGGLTWNEANFGGQYCNLDEPGSADLRLELAGLRFRFEAGERIESSSDGVQWAVAYLLNPLTEADKAYYQKVQTGNPNMRPGPLAGLVDTQYGTIIFAMGHEGVLVRQSSGEWTWAAVGSYHKVEAASIWSRMLTVLNGEIVLGAVLVLLVLSFGAFIRRRHLFWTILIWTGWSGFAFLPMVFPPALSELYLASLSLIAALVIAALAFILSVVGTVMLVRISPVTFWRLLAVALIGGLFYFLPYGLWSINLLTGYYIAESLALIFGVTAGAVGMNLVQNRGKTLQK